MGESTDSRTTLRFDRRLRLEFHGSTTASDAGLLACRELDDALGLTETATACLQESRGGRNVQHQLVALVRQSVYSRLAGYEIRRLLVSSGELGPAASGDSQGRMAPGRAIPSSGLHRHQHAGWPRGGSAFLQWQR